jgi:beta-N-acetylhexosaminidase
MKFLRSALGALGWLALAALWFWAWHLKDPHLRFMRAWELPMLLSALGASAVIAWRFGRRACCGPCRWAWCSRRCSRPSATKRRACDHRAEVPASSGPVARMLGAHFMVGYDDAKDLHELARKGLIGGVFITGRNVKGRTAADLRKEIGDLQALRREAGLPALIVATDQEGGAVSRLSPLIERQPGLSTLLDADVPEAELAQRAHATARNKAVRSPRSASRSTSAPWSICAPAAHRADGTCTPASTNAPSRPTPRSPRRWRSLTSKASNRLACAARSSTFPGSRA